MTAGIALSFTLLLAATVAGAWSRRTSSRESLWMPSVWSVCSLLLGLLALLVACSTASPLLPTKLLFSGSGGSVLFEMNTTRPEHTATYSIGLLILAALPLVCGRALGSYVQAKVEAQAYKLASLCGKG